MWHGKCQLWIKENYILYIIVFFMWSTSINDYKLHDLHKILLMSLRTVDIASKPQDTNAPEICSKQHPNIVYRSGPAYSLRIQNYQSQVIVEYKNRLQSEIDTNNVCTTHHTCCIRPCNSAWIRMRRSRTLSLSNKCPNFQLSEFRLYRKFWIRLLKLTSQNLPGSVVTQHDSAAAVVATAPRAWVVLSFLLDRWPSYLSYLIKAGENIHYCYNPTVDGRIPAPVDMVNSGFHASQVVVWNFLHQQWWRQTLRPTAHLGSDLSPNCCAKCDYKNWKSTTGFFKRIPIQWTNQLILHAIMHF